jgi:hypothetical protein
MKRLGIALVSVALLTATATTNAFLYVANAFPGWYPPR